VRHFIRRATWRAYEEVLAYEESPADDIDVIHKFRSACRQLRYTLELFEGATSFASSVVEPLHALQVRLGDLHDHAVAVALIQKWIARACVPGSPVIADYVSARVRARDELVAEFRQERAAVTALSFREALFRALDGHEARASHGRLRLVPG
jgi:CHAD domain-containing protein